MNRNEYRRGQRVTTLETRTRRMPADFPGWGSPDASAALLPIPAGLHGTVTDVESHGSNPWTRYVVRFDDSSHAPGLVDGEDFTFDADQPDPPDDFGGPSSDTRYREQPPAAIIETDYPRDEGAMAEWLTDVIYDADENDGRGAQISSFADDRLMTNNIGLVVHLPNGAEFQLTIVQSKDADDVGDEEDDDPWGAEGAPAGTWREADQGGYFEQIPEGTE
jgi:hypothetical protein